MAVGGAKGRMGRLVVDLIEADPNTTLTAAVVRPTLNENRASIFQKPIDVFIDFSQPVAVLEHVQFCAEKKIAMVIAVTGLDVEQKNQIQAATKSIPILLSPNLSIGMNIGFKLIALASKILKEKNELPDIAISEIHHRHKKDKPSGTAKKMADIVSEEIGKSIQDLGIQFASLRLGETTGDHRILFSLKEEQLEISHTADDRSIFARGALLAAKWLYQKPPGLYDMQDVLALC